MYRFILFYFVLYICIYVAPWSCEARHLVPLYVHTCSGMTIKLNLNLNLNFFQAFNQKPIQKNPLSGFWPTKICHPCNTQQSHLTKPESITHPTVAFLSLKLMSSSAELLLWIIIIISALSAWHFWNKAFNPSQNHTTYSLFWISYSYKPSYK